MVEARLYKPTARECALLLLHLIATKDEELGREVTRLRVAEITLRRLWGRARLSPELIEEVSDWLLGAGVALFFAGSTYAVIRTTVVESWTRASSKRIKSDSEAKRARGSSRQSPMKAQISLRLDGPFPRNDELMTASIPVLLAPLIMPAKIARIAVRRE